MTNSSKTGLKGGTAIIAAALCFALPNSAEALGLGGGGGGGGGIGVDADVSIGGGGISADVDVSIGGGSGVDAEADVAIGGGTGSGGTGGVDAEVDVSVGGGSTTGTSPDAPEVATAVPGGRTNLSAEERAARERLLLAKRLAAYKGTALLSSDGQVLGRVISVSYSGQGVTIVAKLSAAVGEHAGKTVRLTADPRALDEKRVKLRQSERRFVRGLRNL
ncbi:hypothetical protein FHY55_11870 [Oceanicola sp. D3]|uniref:hypothetical protein n=1 Tax=Oceanicola sp. D3 TaxID=2587163 RepID=UPI0011214F7C|nr:hypothetical protein [Oceanicola sp. D3]QDC09899.1 hypothetical protein FHY55_11870 [Oceanicola sp. D3]